MTTDLETLLNSDQFRELVNAINANEDYKLAKDGLIIESKSNDNSLQINISYDMTKEEEYLANQEAKDFKNLITNIDDDIFVAACERLGSEQLQKIQDCLNSGHLETVRAGIVKFKKVLELVFKERINYYKACLNSLLK